MGSVVGEACTSAPPWKGRRSDEAEQDMSLSVELRPPLEEPWMADTIPR